jgi:hypothetical protein
VKSRLHLTPATALFASALFLGSLLMFLAEPMIAKMLLPHMGGAPMVWNTCVVFFQITLLAGYAYAHGARRLLGPSRPLLVYAALLVLPAVTLPIAIPGSLPSPVVHPTGWLLLALTIAVGLPFFVLAASTSGLQTWFAATDSPGARDPYFLYAASNLGSLLALMLYPTFIEPRLSLGEQSRLWTAGYAMFAMAALACTALAWRSVRGSLRDAVPRQHSEHASWQRRGAWMVLSLIPSSLLLGVTSYLSTDVASVPLLWVVPLSLYLLTFVVAFGSRANRWGEAADRKVPLLVTAVAVFLTPAAGLSVWFAVPLHLSAFGAAAMACHGRLAAERPAPSLLTEFYLFVACGGLLGGLFNTLFVPAMFDSTFEYPLMLLSACVVGSLGRQSWRDIRTLDAVFPAVTFAATAAVVLAVDRTGASRYFMVPGLAFAAMLSFSQSRRRVRFALCIASILTAASLASTTYGRVLHRERTFFGVYRVSVDPSGLLHSLFHGTTLHGVQAREPYREREPLTYYH